MRSDDEQVNEIEELREQLRKALEAYDAEAVGRRDEVTGCHAYMGKLRAERYAANRQAEIQAESLRSALAEVERLRAENGSFRDLLIRMQASVLCPLTWQGPISGALAPSQDIGALVAAESEEP